jgi:DNA-directed RNA polymerase specialized sigma24 family protein
MTTGTRGCFPPPSDEPRRVATDNAVKGRVNAAIAALPVTLRGVLVLRELEDTTYSAVAHR